MARAGVSGGPAGVRWSAASSIILPMPSTWCSGSMRSKDSTLIARRILTYRHQLVASRAYLENCKPPKAPQDLLGHRLLAFSHWKPENSWSFVNANGRDKKTLTFKPYLSMNITPALRTHCSRAPASATFRRWCSRICCATGGSSRLCQSGASAASIFLWFISATVISRSRCACSRNSRQKWRQSCFQCFRLEEGTGLGSNRCGRSQGLEGVIAKRRDIRRKGEGRGSSGIEEFESVTSKDKCVCDFGT
jgi:LysR substrate binding domain